MGNDNDWNSPGQLGRSAQESHQGSRADAPGRGLQTQPLARAPGRSTLTAKLERTAGRAAGARPAAQSAITGATPRARTNAGFSQDVWMDAAHRGTVAFTERDLDPGQARGENTSGAPAAAGLVQRKAATGPGDSGETSPLARARQTRDIDAIKEVDDFGPASTSERLAFLGILLAQQWVGPLDEAAIERIWAAFGPRVLDVASQHRDLWDQSIERGAELDELAAVEATRAKFRADVCLLAHDILRRNEAHVLAEMQALGVTGDGAIDPASSAIPEESQKEHLAHLQWCAYELLAARHAVDELRRLPVGYGSVATEFGVHWVPAYFDPAQPPPLGHDADVSAAMHGAGEMRAWEEVKAHHDRLRAAIVVLAGESPALYAPAAQDDTARLAEMAASPAAEARQTMAATLRELLANIRATVPKIGDDLDDRDLTPLHERLFQGAPGASGINWSNPLHQSIAREVVEGHEDAQFWLSLGLGTAAAAAFVVAELATLGGATFFVAGGAGLAAGGFMAARGWEQWDDLSTAANASTGEQGQIVSQAQAGAALTSAVIDSAFAFLDLVPALQAVRGATAARHGIETAAGQGMEALARGGETTGALVARDGVGETIEHAARQGGETSGDVVATDAAGTGIEQAARQGETSGALVARDAAGEGIEEAAEQGAGTASKRLRPQDAANWQEIEQHYLGKKLEDVGAPPGYEEYTFGKRTFLRRKDGAADRFVQLTVEEGVIRVGPAKSPRITKAERRAQSITSLLENNGLTQRPPHHQAHHVVPDEIVRKHDLMREAYKRGLFDPDGPENIALLAERRANGIAPDKIPGLSEGLPRHQGAHRQYSDGITEVADIVMRDLKQAYGTLEAVPDEVLREASADVLELAWDLLRSWERPHLE
jgi:hypothetical protein